MLPLPQPPGKASDRFDDWMFRLWKRIASTAGMAWSLIDKTGSNLTDLTTRNHADLQNINTANYTHLTSTQTTDLTDGGDSTLHYHQADRVTQNTITGVLEIEADTSYVVCSYLNNNGDLTVTGNLEIL